MNVEIGRVKNPVAERAIQELEEEILHQSPMPGRITTDSVLLALAIASLK